MHRFFWFALVVVLTSIAGCEVHSQQPAGVVAADSLRTHVLTTRDGTVLIGRILTETQDSVRFESVGTIFMLHRSQIAELRSIEPGQLKAR